MCSKNTLNELLKRFRAEVENVFGNKLQDVILYGSYARGDNTDESDIDVMIIADIVTDDELESSLKLSDIVADLNLEFDVVLSPLVESKEKYEKYKHINPLFVNVEREGIRIAA